MTRLLTKWAARWLAKRSHEKRRRTVVEVAQQIRCELNLPDDPRLAR